MTIQEKKRRCDVSRCSFFFFFFVFPSFRQGISNTSVAGALSRGKVSREVLEEVFGDNLLADVDAAVRKEEALSATIRRRARSKSKSKRRRSMSEKEGGSGKGGDRKDEEEAKDSDDDDDEDDEDDEDLFFDKLAGDGKNRGQLQVCGGSGDGVGSRGPGWKYGGCSR